VAYLISKMEPRMKEMERPSKLIARGQIYFQCGEELTTRRDLELLGENNSQVYSRFKLNHYRKKP